MAHTKYALSFFIVIILIIKCDQKTHTTMSFHFFSLYKILFMLRTILSDCSYVGANLSFGSDIAARASRAHAHICIVHMHVCISRTLTEMI